MEARLELVGGDDVHDELSSLRRWLGDEAEFRGRVRIQEAPVEAGQMVEITASGPAADRLAARVDPHRHG